MAEEKSVFDLTEPLDIIAVEFVASRAKTERKALARVAWRLVGNKGHMSVAEQDLVLDALQRRGDKIVDAQRDIIVAQLGHEST